MPNLGDRPAPSFTKQTGTDIEWAMWSSNPITGCLHDCPYCYARDGATSARLAAQYPFGFAPTLHPKRLLSARFMKVPPEAEIDTRYRNVFLGSMADMFGRWVPAEWIQTVLRSCREAPDWNFLCLTKFPKRMAEFDIPPNAWMGTSVDLQARVAAAEAAFANVASKVRWLSCEPLIEPLKFKHLERFHWIVIGGGSASNNTPEWRPPFEWVADLVRQARDAGLKVYFKTNLGIGNRILELPFDAPIVRSAYDAPAADVIRAKLVLDATKATAEQLSDPSYATGPEIAALNTLHPRVKQCQQDALAALTPVAPAIVPVLSES